MEVVPGVHRIEAPLGERFVCLFLFVGDEGALLVDTGLDATPREVLAPYLATIGVEPGRIRYVLNTHADFDHTGGNASARELAPAAVFLCHELDRPLIEDTDRLIAERYGEFAADHGIEDSAETKAWIRSQARDLPIDLGLRGGERLRLGPDWSVEILHTPGHSRGHLSVHDPRHRLLVMADTALWNSVLTADGRPAFPPTYRYLDTYLASIQRLQGMPLDTLLSSHYPASTGAAVAEFLGESRAYADRVDAALRDELARSDRALTMRELIGALAPRLGAWPAGAEVFLAYPFQGHLERLARYGSIRTARRDGLVTWSKISGNESVEKAIHGGPLLGGTARDAGRLGREEGLPPS